MRKTLSASLLTLIVVSVFTVAFSTQQVNAVQGKVGVKVGDWAKYEYVSNRTSDDPAYPPPEIPDVEQIRLTEVLSITGTNITYQIIDYLNNGTEIAIVGWTDVSIGFILSFFMTANLSVGDPVYVGRFLYSVNATLRRTYAGVEREVNYFGITFNNSAQGLLVNGSMHIYWDKVTGVLDEMSTSQHFTNLTHGYTTSTFMQQVIKKTNIWGPTYVSARVNIIPRFLNLKSRGRWLRACIKIPRGYDVKEIDTATVRLNGTIKAELKPRIVRVKWRDSNRGLMVKFERQAVIDLIRDGQLSKFGTVTLTITGSFRDGTQFQGSDSIKIIMSIFTKIWRSLDLSIITMTSGSMMPTINVSDRMIVQGNIGIEDVYADCQNGDIIVFHKPTNPEEIIIHRAVNTVDDSLITKGDNNSGPDPWIIHEEFLVGKVIFIIHTPS